MRTYILSSSGANSQKQLVEVVYTDTGIVPSLKVDPALQFLGLQLLPKQGPLLLCVVLLDKFPAPLPPPPRTWWCECALLWGTSPPLLPEML